MSDSGNPKLVAVIGLGNMGSALAEALLSAGFPVIVWNRTVSNAGPLVKRGALEAKSVAAAAQDADIVIVCVATHEVVVDVIQNDTVAKALKGKLLLQLGVINAKQARLTAVWAQNHDISYLEGSILGVPDNIRKATALLVCSGSRSVFDANKELLSVYGEAQLISETIGAAYEFDKVYFSFAFACALGFIQGAALAYASGYSIEAYTSIVAKRLPAFVEFYNKYGSVIASRQYKDDQAPIEVYADCFAPSLELCRTLGVDDKLPAAMMHNFEKAIEAGYKGKGIPAIFEVLIPKNAEN